MIALVNTTSEFVVALLPVLGVFKLGVERQQRWTVVSLLSLGLIVASLGCIRAHYLQEEIETLDAPWHSTSSWTCSEVEIDVAVVCNFGVLPMHSTSLSTTQ